MKGFTAKAILFAFCLSLACISIASALGVEDLDLTGEPDIGPADAPVQVIIFYDFQCAYCGKTAPVMLDVKNLYGDLVRLVAINVPAPGHVYAEPSAEFAMTAHDQGKFWEAFSLLFKNQSDLSPDRLISMAAEIGVNPATTRKNLDTHAHRSLFKRDFMQAVDIGLSGTPTLFINDVKLVGVQDVQTLKYHINEQLKKKGLKSPVGDVPKPKEKAEAPAFSVPSGMIYPVRELPPVDSKSKLKVGDKAPDFTLPSFGDKQITLKDFQGKKNVVLSFVPAAWTPVCSEQWPEYNEHQDLFEGADAILIGISTDNLPSLFSWTGTMGELWFPVVSDFYPHGKAAKKYGVLRTTGVAERAVFLIDKNGKILFIDIHDINTKPDFGKLKAQLEKLAK